MNLNRLSDVRRLAQMVEELSDGFLESGVSTHFIEIKRGGSGELVVRANREGLVYVASVCLSLAADSTVGHHHQFDEADLVDRCETPLVVVLAEPDWAKSESEGDK